MTEQQYRKLCKLFNEKLSDARLKEMGFSLMDGNFDEDIEYDLHLYEIDQRRNDPTGERMNKKAEAYENYKKYYSENVYDLCKQTGRSRTSIYKLAKKINRMPTAEEVLAVPKGRPKKYKPLPTESELMGGHPGESERVLRYAAIALYENGILTKIFGITPYDNVIEPTQCRQNIQKAIEWAWGDISPALKEEVCMSEQSNFKVIEDLEKFHP